MDCTSTAAGSILHCALELSKNTWLLGIQFPDRPQPSLYPIKGGNTEDLMSKLTAARDRRAKLSGRAPSIVLCYEAGYDAFWLARFLKARGIECLVVDSASMQVNRRARRSKTDRIDVGKLLRGLIAWLRGDRHVWSVVRIPSVDEEDLRRSHRERDYLVHERTAHINRIKATLARLGIRSFNPKLKKAPERLEQLRTPEGEPIPPNALAELQRDMARKQFVAEQIRQIEKARLEQLKQAPKTGPNLMVLVLMRVIGIGIETADMLVKEILSRNMRDRRAVARYGGLTGSPHESGSKSREKGLARSGNARVRRGMIQLAWRFLDYQKDSALARWFEARTKNGSRKKMIVALARKLLIALWHFVRDGVVPEGVVLRPTH